MRKGIASHHKQLLQILLQRRSAWFAHARVLPHGGETVVPVGELLRSLVHKQDTQLQIHQLRNGVDTLVTGIFHLQRFSTNGLKG